MPSPPLFFSCRPTNPVTTITAATAAATACLLKGPFDLWPFSLCRASPITRRTLLLRHYNDRKINPLFVVIVVSAEAGAGAATVIVFSAL